MPFIDTTAATFTPKVTEFDIQPRLGDLLTAHGWRVVANFKKVVFDSILTSPTGVRPPQMFFTIYVAEHFIYANAENKMFGLALTGYWSQNMGKLREINKSPEPGLEQVTLPEFAVWATNEFRKYRAPHTWYIYMLEDLKGLQTNHPDIVMAWSGGDEELKRAALDIEVEETVWDSAFGIPRLVITKAELGRMQSPIIHAGLRTNLLEDYFNEDVYYRAQYTNWWNDSEIAIKGILTDTNLFFIIQCDNVPAPEGNLVPVIPFHFGKIDPIEEGDVAYALFAGSVPFGTGYSNLNSISTYDFDNTNNRPSVIIPLLKSYPKHPANGLDCVMINRCKLGARYQAHYLSWNAPPNAMPPERSNNGKDYPRAWNNAEHPAYKFSFNPSKYSQKVHTSKVYVIHPEEGVRGTLKDTIAFATLTFNANKLRVKKANCPDVYDVYRFFMIDGISPFTKRPGTPYRPAGIGLYFNTVDADGNEITN